MKSTFRVLEAYEYSVVGVLTQRFTTAKSMLDFTKKIATHSEYDEEWDSFDRNLSDLMDKQGVYLTLTNQYFEGHADIIAETTLMLRTKKDVKDVDVRSEAIAGTAIKALFEYLELFNWHGRPSLEGYEYVTEELRHLIAFKS